MRNFSQETSEFRELGRLGYKFATINLLLMHNIVGEVNTVHEIRRRYLDPAILRVDQLLIELWRKDGRTKRSEEIEKYIFNKGIVRKDLASDLSEFE